MEEESSNKEGVVIPEEFQQKTHELIHKADKHQLSHVRDRVYSREDELRKEEDSKKSSKGKAVPSEYSTADMPKGD